MNPKIKTLILTIGRLLITTLGIFGLANIVEPVSLLLEQVPAIWEAVGALVAIGAMFKPYFIKSSNEVKGQMIRKVFDATPSAMSDDSENAFYNFVPKEA